jgi:hypothetical protein
MAALTWRWVVPSAQTLNSATFANDLLAAINAVVTANSSAADAIWEVATYSSTSPRYVLLRRKDLSAGRITYFGQNGSTPNAAAITTGAGGSKVVVGYSASSTSNAHDASYLSAAPLSATDYLPAIACNVNTGTTESFQCYYGECSAGFLFVVLRKTLAVTPTVGCYWGGAGDLFVDTSGAFLPCLISGGDSSSSSWTAATTLAYVDGTISASYSSSNPGLLVRKDSLNYLGFRVFSPVAALNQISLLNDSSNTLHYLPVPIILSPLLTGRRSLGGKLRQIAYGPQALRETFYHDASTDVVVAHAICPHIAAVGDAMWVINREV